MLETLLAFLARLPRWGGLLAFLMVLTQFGSATASMTAVYASGFVASVVVALERDRPLTLGIASILLAWSAVNVFRSNDQVVATAMAVGAVAGGAWTWWFWRKSRRVGADDQGELEDGVGPAEAGGHWLSPELRLTEIQRELGKPSGIDWLLVATWMASLATVFSSLQLSAYAATGGSSGSGSSAPGYGTFLGIDFQSIMVASGWMVVITILGARLGLRKWLRWTIAGLALIVALVDTVASQLGPSTGGPFPPALPWAAVGAGLLLIGLEILEKDGLRALLAGLPEEEPA